MAIYLVSNLAQQYLNDCLGDLKNKVKIFKLFDELYDIAKTGDIIIGVDTVNPLHFFQIREIEIEFFEVTDENLQKPLIQQLKDLPCFQE